MRGVVIAVALAAALGCAPPALAADPVVVVDDAGDNEDAPDLVEVRASHGPGTFVFRITFAAPVPLTPGEQLVTVYLDADRDETSGPDGTELAVRADAAGARLERWVDAQWEPVPGMAVRSTPADGVLTLQVQRAAVGARAFDFVVVASAGDLDLEGTLDSAPDVEPASYDLPAGRRSDATLSPASPRVGGRLSVTRVVVTLADGTREPAATFACVARVGGRTIRPAGRCSWRVPAAARGATLVVSVSARLDGIALPRRTYRVRVR